MDKDITDLSEGLDRFLDSWQRSRPDERVRAKLRALLKDKPACTKLYDCLSRLSDRDLKRAFVNALTDDWEEAGDIQFLVGCVCFEQGQLRLACSFFRDTVACVPNHTKAYRTLGNALRLLGELDEAVEAYRAAIGIQPNRGVHSRLLLALNFSPSASPEAIAEEHRHWGALYFPAPIEREFSPDKLRDDKERLTIGYASPDFRSHPVAYFIQPILATHDRTRFRIISYATARGEDGVTRRIKGMVDQWREVAGSSAEQLAQTILEDDVDILVDLAGHTSGNRLDVFSHRAAPVQATYLGYPNTTGLRSIDYRITDGFTDPVGVAERWHSERLFRLDPGFLTFEPPHGCPDVEPTPAEANGYVTFGSFNKFSKVSQPTIEAWVAIVNAVPRARLLLKTGSLQEQEEKTRAIQLFVDAGLDDPRRIEIIDLVPSRTEHLRLYGRLDVALDPFPYNGTTTTCQALYMGVPVVALLGGHHAARVGGSVLNQVGLQRLIARDVGEYVQIAVDLASDVGQLASLRRSMRPLMQASPLRDHRGFTEKLEASYRKMWRDLPR